MRLSRIALLGWCLALGWLGLRTLPSLAQNPPERPKLIVLLVIDQFRGDFLTRWNELFVEDGFKRLQAISADFRQCHYPYACTMTGPGHASLSTGTTADKHGIISNDWYDREAAASVYCAASARYKLVYTQPPRETVPAANLSASAKKKLYGGNPDNLRATPFADRLKQATQNRSRVVSVSLKDRSAVLPGGFKCDACYWFDDQTGSFVTSTFYRDQPHAWVNEFNRERLADRWFSETWTRLRPELDYTRYSGPDDQIGEGTGILRKQGRVFPHPMNAGLKQPGPEYYDTLESSPFGNELLLQFALRAIEAEKLGTRDEPDFLNISFSSNDLVGHIYGPDSHEVLDTTLRTDLVVRDLLKALDRAVGPGKYALAMSADHGICPMPEVSVSRGQDARRIEVVPLAAAAVLHLNKTFGSAGLKSLWIENQAFPWIYLNHNLIRSKNLKVEDVAENLAGFFREQPGILRAYTRAQIERSESTDDPYLISMRSAYFPPRCGDLALVTRPYDLISTYSTGTSHGTPHPYDTHVPLLVTGPGVSPGVHNDRIAPQSVIAILARLAGVPIPPGEVFPVPPALKLAQP